MKFLPYNFWDVTDREVVANGLKKVRVSQLLSTSGTMKVSMRVTPARVIHMQNVSNHTSRISL